MIFYEYTYELNQEMQKAFQYFLQKEYLTKIFQEAEEEIALHAEHEESTLQEGERLELIIGDATSISSFQIEVLEIVPLQLIDLSINVNEFVDKGLSTLEEDEEAMAFMKKHMGLDMYFRLEFFEDFGSVRVVESAELKKHDLAWYAKGFWKVLGWYYQFKHRKIHQQIVEEIER